MCNTMETFWQMIWKLNIRDIFCLTKAQENGKEMALIYWKNTDDCLLDEFKVKVNSKTEEGIAIKRDIDFINNFTKENRKMFHFHIECWDDDKAPTSPEDIDALLDVAEQCSKELQSKADAKVVVHCSAGIGRTGVFICLVEIFTFLSSLANKTQTSGLSIQEICQDDPTAVISIFDLVRSLREQRWGSVKTFVGFASIRLSISSSMRQQSIIFLSCSALLFNNNYFRSRTQLLQQYGVDSQASRKDRIARDPSEVSAQKSSASHGSSVRRKS